jgi:hypothetical protein
MDETKFIQSMDEKSSHPNEKPKIKIKIKMLASLDWCQTYTLGLEHQKKYEK